MAGLHHASGDSVDAVYAAPAHHFSGVEPSILDERTLVLNRSWRAVNVTTVRRAITLVYQRLARVIQPETFDTHDFESWASITTRRGDPCIRTVSLNIRVPEIIVLASFDGHPEMRVPFSRRNLFLRDGLRCQYCGEKSSSEDLSIDHIVPRSRGGTSTWTNCVLACLACNVRKGDRTPEEARMKLLRPPARPRWTPYLSVHLGKRRASWQRFLSDRYWNVELEP